MEIADILQRVAASFLAGLLLGLERERRGRAAGLRTIILVCMAATITMILSDIYYTSHVSGPAQGWRPDPGRLGAGILTGMGFLGAGVIIRHGPSVQGVTTAALMWFSTVIGFCFGSGQMFLGMCSVLVAAVVLYALPFIGSRIRNEQTFALTVVTKRGAAVHEQILEKLQSRHLSPLLTEVLHDNRGETQTSVVNIRFRDRHHPTPQEIAAILAAEPDVLTVQIR
ncbi:MAG: MgtC/SapB family protein [Opitutaceae bacterium]|nr:MgtC/SapB family protein [Opitutaceae bacterium]